MKERDIWGPLLFFAATVTMAIVFAMA